jgi:ribbon-helix-helix CopG family protein
MRLAEPEDKTRRRTNVSLHPAAMEALRKAAWERDVPMSRIVEEAIEAHLGVDANRNKTRA